MDESFGIQGIISEDVGEAVNKLEAELKKMIAKNLELKNELASAEKVSIQEFIELSENRFKKFKQAWRNYAYGTPLKIEELKKAAFYEHFGSDYDDYDDYGDYDDDLSPMEKAVKLTTLDFKKIVGEYECYVTDIDEKIQFYVDEGADDILVKNLIDHVFEWLDYTYEMYVELEFRSFSYSPDDDIKNIEKKWKAYLANEKLKKEAEQYGVSVENLEIHKKYLDAKSKKPLAKNVAQLKEVMAYFNDLGNYLDSGELAKECRELIGKEEERIRLEKQREEEAKRAEEEKRRKAQKEFDIAAAKVKSDRSLFVQKLNKEAEEKYNQLNKSLKKLYADSCESNNDQKSILQKEKEEVEKELKSCGFFSFKKKKQLSEQIEVLDRKLKSLADEKQKIETEYKDSVNKANEARDNAKRENKKLAEKKYPMPSMPSTR